MRIPESMREVTVKAIQENPSDIEAQKQAVFDAMPSLPDWADIQATFRTNVAEQAVFRIRGEMTAATKQGKPYPPPNEENAGHEGNGLGPVNVTNSGACREVQEVTDRWYNAVFIGGKALGDVKGEEIPGLESAERQLAEGHTENADLLAKLRPLVPEGKSVREAVSYSKLAKIAGRIFRAVSRKKGEADAA